MGVKIELFEFGACRSDLCLWGWMKSEVCKEKENTRDESVARITNSAALMQQERQDDLRRATRTLLLPRGLESALKAMVGFVNTFFVLSVGVLLSIFISVINQLDTQNFCFTISLFHASTCFEHMCSSSGGQNCITLPLTSSLNLCTRRPPIGVMIPEAV